MSDKILVTYASRYGSTQEVAEKVAAILGEGGLEVDLQPMREVRALDGYGAVVLGAPLFIMKWHKDARRFLGRYQKALMQRPVAIFALGPLQPEEMDGCRKQLDQELAKHTWLAPIALALFVGKYDPARLTFPHNLIANAPASPLYGVPASDNRDWAAIQAWATDVAGLLRETVA